MYERWLQEEMNWIGAYCSKIRRQALCITAPLILVGSAVLIGALTAFGGGSAADFGYGAFSGFVVGALICGIYLMVLLPALRPKRYGKKIDRCVRGLSLSEGEKEELAREMLEADEGHRISYTITGPGAKGTPGESRPSSSREPSSVSRPASCPAVRTLGRSSSSRQGRFRSAASASNFSTMARS